MSITVGKLKQVLQDAIDSLDGYDNEQKVHLVSNTYFINNARYFLGISGYNGGYCNLSTLEVEEDEDE